MRSLYQRFGGLLRRLTRSRSNPSTEGSSFLELPNGRAVVFIHINKTAGMSVVQALGFRGKCHQTVAEVQASISPEDWSRAYRFTFVRNPWDKVVSHYEYRVRTNQTGLGDGAVPFAEWVSLAYGDQDPRYYDQPKMFAPQVEWLRDEAGGIPLDFVGRFERLSEDFEVVARSLGLSARLPHLNRTQRRHYRDYYSPETRSIVAEWFREDLEQFGYSY